MGRGNIGSSTALAAASTGTRRRQGRKDDAAQQTKPSGLARPSHPALDPGRSGTLAVALFVVNYANVMKWQIRAQNAANTAAEAAVVASAEGFNELELTMYTTTIAENRLRYLNQALMNNLEGVGCTGTATANPSTTVSLPSSRRAANLRRFPSDPGLARAKRQRSLFRLLDGAFETITGYQYADGRQDAMCVSQGVACVNQTDQAFTYTPLDIDAGDVGFGTPNLTEVASCKQVSLISPGMLGLSKSLTFRAVGVGAFTVVSVPEKFNPGSPTVNPITKLNTIYQPIEYWAPTDHNIYTDVDYSGLNVTVFFYVPNPTPPYKTFNPSTASCS